ncbi:MAG: shikimate dehydrogenase [Gammaproteobacteria bacterium]
MTDIFDFGSGVDRYAVVGNPIAHSKSPRIHRLFAEQTGQRMEYTAIQVDTGGFEQAVGNFQASGGKGLNITVPFKEEAWAFVDRRTPRAERAGAVNTIKFENDRVLGDNTDGVGLVNDLLQNHGTVFLHKRILLMGAGGAARGVIAPLLEQQPASITVVNRTVDKAVALAELFKDLGVIEGCGYDDLEGRYDIIINATAASLAGDLPPVPPASLGPDSFCYDMMYGAEPTVFMRWAQQQGVPHCSDGLGMLVGQAAESFYVWRGVRPDTGRVITQLRSELTA